MCIPDSRPYLCGIESANSSSELFGLQSDQIRKLKVKERNQMGGRQHERYIPLHRARDAAKTFSVLVKANQRCSSQTIVVVSQSGKQQKNSSSYEPIRDAVVN